MVRFGKTILATGGTGFIGSNFVSDSLEPGERLRGGERAQGKISPDGFSQGDS